MLGWKQGADISEWGYKYLVTQARLRDGGWARKLSRHGAHYYQIASFSLGR